MEVVEIRQKVVLDAMLDALDLPSSTSEAVIDMDGTAIVTVMFFPSAMRINLTNGQHSCQSNPHNSVRAAENEAVHEAIQYMECCQRKTPRDYNHFRVHKRQESEAYLYLQLNKKDQEFNQLASNRRSFIGDIHVASEKIEMIVQRNLGGPRYGEERNIGSEFLELEKAISDLKHVALRSARLAETTGLACHGHRTLDDEFNDDTTE